MTRIDFYILSDRDADARERFACRLANKAVQAGQRVHLHASTEAHCKALDELLWHYPDHQFLPHEIQQQGCEQSTPLVIHHQQPAADMDQVLINLGTSIPDFFGRFDRVAEIVVASESAQGRERYRFYRDRGYPLFHHELDDWEEK